MYSVSGHKPSSKPEYDSPFRVPSTNKTHSSLSLPSFQDLNISAALSVCGQNSTPCFPSAMSTLEIPLIVPETVAVKEVVLIWSTITLLESSTPEFDDLSPHDDSNIPIIVAYMHFATKPNLIISYFVYL